MGWKAAGLIRISGLENGTDVDVLEAIATFLNEDDGHCFPALTSVMVVARKSRNVVRQSIKDLTEQGLLSFSEEPGKVRSYVIHFQNLPEPKLKKAFEEFFRRELRKKTNPVQKLTGFRSEPGNEVNREGVQKCTPTGFRSEPPPGSEVNPEQGNNKEENKERNREVSMRTSGNSSAIAAVASAQAQTLPTSFPQSSNSQNHSETKTAGKDSLPNASERSVAAHRDRLDASDEQTLQNGTRRSQNASTSISVACPENEPPPMSDEDLENLFANAQLEECPPFPEKGVRPPFEKGVRLPDVSEKGDHLSTATKRRATTRRKPSTPCPFDMESSIPDEYLEIAKKAGIGDPQRVFSSFVAHAVANGRRLIVWPAGFRNWCDNELKWHPDQKPKITPQSQKSAKDYEWI